MDPTKYQALAARTECNQQEALKNYIDIIAVRLNHAVMGLAGEVGELAGALEHWLHYGKQLDRTNLKEEIGDCLWYLALACNALEVDLGEMMDANIRKLTKRYPDKYSNELAEERNRNRQVEREAIESLPNKPPSNTTCTPSVTQKFGDLSNLDSNIPRAEDAICEACEGGPMYSHYFNDEGIVTRHKPEAFGIQLDKEGYPILCPGYSDKFARVIATSFKFLCKSCKGTINEDNVRQLLRGTRIVASCPECGADMKVEELVCRK